MGVLLIYNSFLMHLPLGLSVQSSHSSFLLLLLLLLQCFFFFFPQLLCEDVTRSCWRECPKKQQSRSWRFVCACADCTAPSLCNTTFKFLPWCFSPQIRWSVQQVLEGLRYLHQKNIAHLDIKVALRPNIADLLINISDLKVPYVVSSSLKTF